MLPEQLTHQLWKPLNAVQVPEYAVHAALTLLLLLCGKWGVAALNLPVLAFNGRTLLMGQHTTDVTEIFRQLPRERRIRMFKLAAYMVSFIYIVYR